MATDQDEILKSLAKIEKELDALLSEGLDRRAIAADVEFFNNPLLSKSDNFYEMRGVRHQVFEKSYKLNQYVEEIASGVAQVHKEIDSFQKTGDDKS